MPSPIYRTALLIASLTVAPTSVVYGNSARPISWENLLSPDLVELERRAGKLQKQLDDLGPDVSKTYRDVSYELSVRSRIDSGILDRSDLIKSEREILAAKPSASHPEAVAFWSEVSKLNDLLDAEGATVDPAMNGEIIRIPGYMLPLEFNGTKVREFLLVPYVGACIHSPPPPANQMVYVTTSEGFESAGLYTPVWVEGTVSTTAGSYDLSLVDGNREVSVGYSLRADKIEKYQ